MSENVNALIWRAGQPDVNGDMLTPEALATMAKVMRPGMKITLGWDFRQVIGRVVRSWIQDSDLYATIALDDSAHAKLVRDGRLAFRPGFSIEAQHASADGVRIVDKIDCTYVSLTPNPMPLPGE